jgi:hypothetical protein
MMNIKVPKGTPMILFYMINQAFFGSIEIVSEEDIEVSADIGDGCYKYRYNYVKIPLPMYKGKPIHQIMW